MARTRDVINIIFSVSGVVIGLAASISFYIYGNSLAVFWAFFSACLALLTLHLHCLHQNGKLEEWHTEDTMNAIRALSVVMSITLTGVVVWFVFKIWYEHLQIVNFPTFHH